MSDNEPLSASLEDYLETIYELIRTQDAARSGDIARAMGVTAASVTGALRALGNRNLVNYAPYEAITLTDEGMRVAEGIAGRHRALKEFFVGVLGANESEAGDNACRIEHAISEDLMERLISFAEFLRVCPRAGTRWVEGFGYFRKHPQCGQAQEECDRCMSGAGDAAD